MAPQPLQLGTKTEMKYNKETLHILLDAGHTERTPGKRVQLPEGGYFFEWEFNHYVVDLLAYKLRRKGFTVHIICPERDMEVSNMERARRANTLVDMYGAENCLFISIHANAFGDGTKFTTPGGWEVWTTKGKTNSDDIATVLFEEAEKRLVPEGFKMRKDTSDKDPDKEENFTVIYYTRCPAVLSENLFYTNEEECRWMQTDYGVETIADIHLAAIERLV